MGAGILLGGGSAEPWRWLFIECAEVPVDVGAFRDVPGACHRRGGQEAAQGLARHVGVDGLRRGRLRVLPSLPLRPLRMRRARSTPALPRMSEPMSEAVPSSLPLLLVGGVVGLATVAAVVASNGNPAVALVPCLIALLLWAICSLPLRVPMLALLALSWIVEVAGDAFAGELVETPLKDVGTFLFERLSLTFGIDALVFRGF